MKAQIILIFLLTGVVSSKALAAEAESESEPKQEVKKTTKSKYDFNIFKLYSFVNQQEKPDSLKPEIKALPIKRNENN
ncbi:MAG: hypothetical protein ACPGSL_00630 [Vicingaceae bacterium]